MTSKKRFCIIDTIESNREYIQALQQSKIWKKWQELHINEITEAINLKRWLQDRPALNLAQIELKNGLGAQTLTRLAKKNIILSTKHMNLVNPALHPFGWVKKTRKAKNVKKFLTERRAYLHFAVLENEAELTPYTINSHVNGNHKISLDTYKKLTKILPKYGYWE